MHIGLFDSGMGGLVVLNELKKRIPQVRYSYLGDLVRLPYGEKPLETLEQYRFENIRFLESLGVDMILIACHSISSFSLEFRQTKSGTPVYNMIAPCGEEIFGKTKNKKIGVIATEATIGTGIYSRFLKTLDGNLRVFSKACPELVPMIERGLTGGAFVRQTLKNYLDPLVAEDIDTLLLGCSHYFLLEKSLSQILGSSTSLIHPAVSVACFMGKKCEENLEGGPLKTSSVKNPESGWNQGVSECGGSVAVESIEKPGWSRETGNGLTVYLTGHSSPFVELCRKLLPDLSPERIISIDPF